MGYSSEIAPVPLRGFLTTYIAFVSCPDKANALFTAHEANGKVNSLGQLLSAGVFRGMASIQGEWSYRIPFAVQWVWIIPLFIIATFAPESPWFLVRCGKLLDAEKAVGRLGKTSDTRNPERIVAMMVSGNPY